MTEFAEMQRISVDIVDYVQRTHNAEPMQATAAMAFALGAMVGSLNELGLTKQGQSGRLMRHLFAIAEEAAMAGTGA